MTGPLYLRDPCDFGGGGIDWNQIVVVTLAARLFAVGLQTNTVGMLECQWHRRTGQCHDRAESSANYGFAALEVFSASAAGGIEPPADLFEPYDHASQ